MSQISPQKSSVSSPAATQANSVQRRAPWLYAFWKFSRPHTIIGTTLSVFSLFGIAVVGEPIPLVSALMQTVLPTLLACLCGNVYIVGLNQLEDVGIDRVNKPHLPLASGEFSRREAQAIVATTGILSILLALAQGWYLFAMVSISLSLGTAYSLPPLRLKRFPFWASFCIFTVRGVVVNLGLFLHFSHTLQINGQIPPIVWALTLFILVFTFAIALFKDIPDIEGDRRYNVSTFTIRLGQRAVFRVCRWVLTTCYVGIMAASLGLPDVNGLFLVVTHGLALGVFWFYSWQVNLADKGAIARFYQFIWKLFFMEYFIIPLACFLR